MLLEQSIIWVTSISIEPVHFGFFPRLTKERFSGMFFLELFDLGRQTGLEG